MLGTTLDDAAGEAFDKGARLLGLGYPAAGRSTPSPPRRPRGLSFPVARVPGLDFSFSGLKTALLYRVRDLAPGRARASPRRPGRELPARDRPRSRRADRGRRRRPDRRRGRRRGQLGASRGPAARRARAPRALHRQRRDDRLGGPLHQSRPIPRVPFTRCPRGGRLNDCWRSVRRRSPSRVAVVWALRTDHGPPKPLGRGGELARARRCDAHPRRKRAARDRRAEGPSLADRVEAAGGRATEAQERSWTAAAYAAQQQVLTLLAFDGITVEPGLLLRARAERLRRDLDPRAARAARARRPGRRASTRCAPRSRPRSRAGSAGPSRSRQRCARAGRALSGLDGTA